MITNKILDSICVLCFDIGFEMYSRKVKRCKCNYTDKTYKEVYEMSNSILDTILDYIPDYPLPIKRKDNEKIQLLKFMMRLTKRQKDWLKIEQHLQ